jgi:hypothetical protein
LSVHQAVAGQYVHLLGLVSQHQFAVSSQALVGEHQAIVVCQLLKLLPIIVFALFTCSQTFQAKSQIISQFESVNLRFSSQAVFQNHHHVFVARFLARDVYIVFVVTIVVGVHSFQHPILATHDTPLDIYQFQTPHPDQFVACCSIFLAIVIHSSFVIK